MVRRHSELSSCKSIELQPFNAKFAQPPEFMTCDACNSMSIIAVAPPFPSLSLGDLVSEICAARDKLTTEERGTSKVYQRGQKVKSRVGHELR